MTAEKYIVVKDVKKSTSYSHDTEMEMFDNEREVIQHIGLTSSSASEDRTKIERVFKVDEYGLVTYYEVVFSDGRFKLKAIPQVSQG